MYKKRHWKRPEAANDPKYRPFHSIDDNYANYSYIWCIPLFFFYIPRFIMGWACFCFSPVVYLLLRIGDPPNPLGLMPEWK